MPRVNVYHNFDGNCEEAFNFYQSAFGGTFPYIGRFADLPSVEGLPPLPEDYANRIMHVSLPISAETMLMGCDAAGDWGPGSKQGNNFAVSITTESKAEADKLFAALSEGGDITMPLDHVFWGDYFGMFTDKFGIAWMVSFKDDEKK